MNDWILVFAFSVPVIFIDEILKLISKHILKNNLVDDKKKN